MVYTLFLRQDFCKYHYQKNKFGCPISCQFILSFVQWWGRWIRYAKIAKKQAKRDQRAIDQRWLQPWPWARWWRPWPDSSSTLEWEVVVLPRCKQPLSYRWYLLHSVKLCVKRDYLLIMLSSQPWYWESVICDALYCEFLVMVWVMWTALGVWTELLVVGYNDVNWLASDQYVCDPIHQLFFQDKHDYDCTICFLPMSQIWQELFQELFQVCNLLSNTFLIIVWKSLMLKMLFFS